MLAGLASSNFNHWGCNGDGASTKTFTMALVPALPFVATGIVPDFPQQLVFRMLGQVLYESVMYVGYGMCTGIRQEVSEHETFEIYGYLSVGHLLKMSHVRILHTLYLYIAIWGSPARAKT